MSSSKRRCAAALSVATCALALLACGDDGSGTMAAAPDAAPTATAAPVPAAATTTRVTLKDISFTPETVTVAPGDSVRWTWKDHDVPHNVTFADRHSATKHQGGTYRLKFMTKGTFRYECTIHPGMVGKVVVA